MSEQEFCTCDIPMPLRSDNVPFCAVCGLHFEPSSQVTVDRTLLVQLVQVVSELSLSELILCGCMIDEARGLQVQCQQIIQEYGE